MIEMSIEHAVDLIGKLIEGMREDDEENAVIYLSKLLTREEKKLFNVPEPYEHRLDAMVEADWIDMDEMLSNASYEPEFNGDLHSECIYTHEELKDVLIQHIEHDDECSELFKSVQECYDMYVYDDSMCYNGATPIQNKEELKQVLLYGTL